MNHCQHVKCTEVTLIIWHYTNKALRYVVTYVQCVVLLAEVTGELGGMLPLEPTGTEVGWDKQTFRRTVTRTGLVLVQWLPAPQSSQSPQGIRVSLTFPGYDPQTELLDRDLLHNVSLKLGCLSVPLVSFKQTCPFCTSSICLRSKSPS